MIKLKTPDQVYFDAAVRVAQEGEWENNRTGVKTKSLFEPLTMKFRDVAWDFPLLQTKKVWWKGVFMELVWMMSGVSNSKTLEERGVNVWKKWGHPVTRFQGDINFYNENFRRGFVRFVKDIQRNPSSRRNVFSLWRNYSNWEIVKVHDHDTHITLPPCHGTVIQVKEHRGMLNMIMTQRSADMFLGVPWNIAFYSFMLMIISEWVGIPAGDLFVTTHDSHIYENHFAGFQQQYARLPLVESKTPVTVNLKGIPNFESLDNNNNTLFNWWMDNTDFTSFVQVYNYDPFPAIKADVAV